ncbi:MULTISPECIES: sensor histidine kinase [unclassified Streptomyces]|uniref:sensor histidine kinase n=1 Tax=unclassified Streptomyces TaxID=2593676 RepID=UPI0011E6C5FA|nr:sensor histidine kinase [Streptomyces sp. sk2.1]TXS70501.1 sensor histidine kinase [Streptomyces sp. sk2.1]
MTKRAARVLRELPRTLHKDLMTSATDPNGRYGQPRWLDWRPVIMVPLVLLAVFLLVANTNQYTFELGTGLLLGLLFAGIQAVALVVTLYRPVPAWWTSVLVMVVVTPFAANAGSGQMVFPREGITVPDRVAFPWNGAGIAVQAGVLFLLALRVRPRITAEALTITVLVGFACGAAVPWDDGPGPGVAAAVLLVAAVMGAALRGLAVARTRLVVQEELTAEERARRTLLEERNRIARELHDVVAHHMSVISIQAQVVPHLVDNPSDELRENVEGIRRNAVDALTELRRVLGVLRSEDPLPQAARHAPQPTLDRLDELIGNARGAGVEVTAGTTGKPRPLSPGVELSAFRIVQEALSNAMRHAPGARVRVEIGHGASEVTVRVTNTAPGRAVPPSPGAGHGLLGMRERAAMLGGEIVTGPTPDGGYEVAAILPAQPPAGHTAPADPAEDHR